MLKAKWKLFKKLYQNGREIVFSEMNSGIARPKLPSSATCGIKLAAYVQIGGVSGRVQGRMMQFLIFICMKKIMIPDEDHFGVEKYW